MVKVYVQSGGADESRPTVKEVVLMRKRILMVLAVALVMAAMMVAMAAPAFAQGSNPQGLGKDDTDSDCGIGNGGSGDFFTYNRGNGSVDHFDYSDKGNGDQQNPQGQGTCM
jgi:hypothetical protein